MIKKFNLILIGFGICLTQLYNFGFILLIPVFLFYIQKDLKSTIYLIPSMLLSSLLFAKETMIPLVLTLLILTTCSYLIQKTKTTHITKYTLHTVLLLITNIISYLLLNIDLKIIYYILYFGISICIYIFLCFEEYLYLFNIVKKPIIYTEHIIVIISILGACNITLINIQLGLILSAYFVIYYSRTYHNIYSLLLGVILFIILYLGFNQEEALLILLLCTIYYFDYNYLFFLVNIILFILSITSTIYKQEFLYYLMILLVLFEFIWLLIKKEHLKEISKEYIYNLKLKSIENEYLSFAGFLDYYIDSFSNSKDYLSQLSTAISHITDKHCALCNKQSSCFKNNKNTLFFDLKTLIEEQTPPPYLKQHCTSLSEMTKTKDILKHQITKKTDPTNTILIQVLNKIKQVLTRHQEDLYKKKLIDFCELLDFHTKLYESPFNIKDIRYNKIYVDDLNIEVIINKKELTNQENLITLLKNTIKYAVNIQTKETKTEYIFTIILKEKIHIKYGCGTFSSKQNELCGDNYLINSYDSGHFLACISDGMGKGYKAFEDSRRVLETLENLNLCQTSITTNIEILNLLYILQGYTERFSTIDAVDINRCNRQAVIYKLGATSSYIFHEDSTYQKITNKCLPLGIEDEIYHEQVTLKNNDLILLSSDGIFENVEQEKNMLDLINKLKTSLPEKIAYEILEYTIKSKVKVKDDMSIIVLKVEEIN